MPQKILYEVLMTTTVIEFSGNNFQLHDYGNLTRESYQKGRECGTQFCRRLTSLIHHLEGRLATSLPCLLFGQKLATNFIFLKQVDSRVQPTKSSQVYWILSITVLRERIKYFSLLIDLYNFWCLLYSLNFIYFCILSSAA